jgi:tetratricopeptide (TPR) repeat protein/SAM-dependent methyltransferase
MVLDMSAAGLSGLRRRAAAQADAFERLRRFSEARRALFPLITMTPDDANAHLRIGMTFLRQKQPAEAAAAFGRAVDLAPGWDQARLHYAQALAALDRHGDALHQFSALLALRPGQDQGHCGRGRTFLALDRAADAVVACQRAHELAPSSGDALFWLGCSQARQSNRGAAIAAFRRATLLQPGSAVVAYRLGLQYQQAGRPDEAATSFNRLRALAPQNGEGHLQWGMTMAKLGRLGDAVDGLGKAVALRPAWPLPRLELWRNLVKTRRFPKALALLRSAGDLTVTMALNRRDAFYTLDQAVRRALALGGLPRAIEQAGALVDGIAAQAAAGPPLDAVAKECLLNAITTAPDSALDGAARAILASDWRGAFSSNAAWTSGASQPLPAKYAVTVHDGPHRGHPLWHLLSPFYHAWIAARAEDSGRAVQQRWAVNTHLFDSAAPVDDLLAAVTSIVEAHRPFIEALASRAGGKRVIDIGCGRGEWLYILGRDLGVPIDGLLGCDLHEGRVRSARELLSHLSHSRNLDADATNRALTRNLFAADLLAMPAPELIERCGRVDLALLSRITSVFNDAQLDHVLGQIAALNPPVIAEVCPTERWSYSFGRLDLTPYFARHGYRAAVHGWLPETATAEALRHLALPRKYWVATRYYVFERASG